MHHKNKKDIAQQYMLINLCQNSDFPKNIDYNSFAVLAFDAFNIKFEFNSSKVEQLRIKKAYSMSSEKESFGGDIKIDVTFPVSEATLEIPVAYAFITGNQTSLHIENIYNIKRQGNKDPLRFLENERDVAKKYIAFKETAYLIECLTNDDVAYEYSLFLEIDKFGWYVPHKIRNGNKFFYKKVKEAKKEIDRNNRNIVQHSEKLNF